MIVALRKRSIPREIFLSHSSGDHAGATEIALVLRKHGLRVWYSKTHIEPAQQWHDEIGRALKRCDWFIVLLSPSAVTSKWVKQELMYALNHDQYDN